MTKEKTIINEIDVTDCTYRRQNPHNFCMCASIINESGNIIELTRYVQCEYNPNCYFKQLKRKEQECEELKEDRERWKSNFNGKVSAIEELLQQLDQFKAKEQEVKRYKQVLDKIERYLDKQQKYLDGEDYHNLLDIINKTKE